MYRAAPFSRSVCPFRRAADENYPEPCHPTGMRARSLLCDPTLLMAPMALVYGCSCPPGPLHLAIGQPRAPCPLRSVPQSNRTVFIQFYTNNKLLENIVLIFSLSLSRFTARLSVPQSSNLTLILTMTLSFTVLQLKLRPSLFWFRSLALPTPSSIPQWRPASGQCGSVWVSVGQWLSLQLHLYPLMSPCAVFCLNPNQ